MRGNKKETVRVGRRIRVLREERGWSQATLGKKAGLDAADVCKIESGYRADIGIGRLSRIAKGLGVELHVLLFERAA